MATRKSTKPVGRGVNDEEVKTAYHDEVLNWLIDKLDVVVADRWGMSPEAVATELGEAKEQACQWLKDTVVPALSGYGAGSKRPGGSVFAHRNKSTELKDETKATLLKAAAGAPEVSKAIKQLRALESTGDAVVKSFEVMKQVARIERKVHREDIRIAAGYVDLEAVIVVPESLRITIPGISREEGYGSAFQDLADDEEFVKAAHAFAPDQLHLASYGERHRVWFSVRTSPFTLGEILQELKELRSLESGTSIVALVVDGIDPRMCELIEREAFTVIDVDDYRA